MRNADIKPRYAQVQREKRDRHELDRARLLAESKVVEFVNDYFRWKAMCERFEAELAAGTEQYDCPSRIPLEAAFYRAKRMALALRASLPGSGVKFPPEYVNGVFAHVV